MKSHVGTKMYWQQWRQPPDSRRHDKRADAAMVNFQVSIPVCSLVVSARMLEIRTSLTLCLIT